MRFITLSKDLLMLQVVAKNSGDNGATPKPSDEKSFDALIIEQVQCQPCLYDANHADYAKAKIWEATWTRIGRKLKVPGRKVARSCPLCIPPH